MKTLRLLLPLLAFATTVAAQTPTKALRFDAASVKPAHDTSVSPSMHATTGGFSANGWTVKTVMAYAFNFSLARMVGGPSWLDSDTYDIVARTNRPETTMEEVREMIKNVLADRFALRVHVEERPAPIYALTVMNQSGKLGPALKASQGCDKNVVVTSLPQTTARTVRACGTRVFMDRMIVTVESGAKPIADLVWAIQGPVGTKVVDRTGLQGLFDFDLRFTPDATAPRDVGDVPAIFTALREQLGLELKSEAGSIEVLVIDHIERPSEN